jgi:hypothetical protein
LICAVKQGYQSTQLATVNDRWGSRFLKTWIRVRPSVVSLISLCSCRPALYGGLITNGKSNLESNVYFIADSSGLRCEFAGFRRYSLAPLKGFIHNSQSGLLVDRRNTRQFHINKQKKTGYERLLLSSRQNALLPCPLQHNPPIVLRLHGAKKALRPCLIHRHDDIKLST